MRPIQITLVAWIAYLLTFPVLHAFGVNDNAAVFVLFPLLTTAWQFGRIGGWLGAALMWPAQISLFLLSNHSLGWEMVGEIEGMVGLATLSTTTWTIPINS